MHVPVMSAGRRKGFEILASTEGLEDDEVLVVKDGLTQDIWDDPPIHRY